MTNAEILASIEDVSGMLFMSDLIDRYFVITGNIKQLADDISEYLRFFLSIQTVLLALVLRLLYRKSGYLLIEMLVFALFVGGYHYFFSILTSLLSKLLSTQATQFSFVGLVLTFGYTVWAITQFFDTTKSRGRQIAKAIGTELLVYGLFFTLTILLTIAYVFFVLKPPPA